MDRHSWVYFTPGEKAARAVRLFLDHFGLRLPPRHWRTHSELRVGVGMASSTADIVATLRCLFRVFGLPYDQGVVTGVLAAIERADSVFLDEFALHLSARHQVVRTLGTAIGFHTAFVTEPGTVDTSAVTAPLLRHYARRASEYERCLTDLLKGFESPTRPPSPGRRPPAPRSPNRCCPSRRSSACWPTASASGPTGSSSPTPAP